MTPSTLTNDTGTTIQEAVSRFGQTVRAPLRATAFWAAIVLPFMYLPLLVGGLTQTEFVAFFGLIFANAVALVVGHNHGNRSD